MSQVLRTEVVAHRASKRSAQAYIDRFADAIGDTTMWTGGESVPIHIDWQPVRVITGGFDIVSTVTSREV